MFRDGSNGSLSIAIDKRDLQIDRNEPVVVLLCNTLIYRIFTSTGSSIISIGLNIPSTSGVFLLVGKEYIIQREMHSMTVLL